MLADINTPLASPENAEKEFLSSGTLSTTIPRCGARRLWSKINKHRSFAHWTALLQLVAAQEWMYPSILTKLAEECDDEGTLNAVATSRRTPTPTLRHLARTATSITIREHSELNIISRAISRMTTRKLFRLIDEHRGDDGIALGVRCMIARDENTPTVVLVALKQDDADFVRDTATETLRKRAPEQERKW